MYLLIRELLDVLTPSQLKRLGFLQALLALMAFAEVASVAAIGLFMAVVANASVLDPHHFIGQLYRFSGLGSPAEFIRFVGVMTLALLVATALVSMLTVWRSALFSVRVGQEIADSLYRYYMHRPWLFHAGGSSAELTKKIASESYIVASQILYPLMQINAKVILTMFMIGGLLLLNPWVVFMALAIFGCAYAVLYALIRRRLVANGRRISEFATRRYKLMAEGFGGIKDVLLLGRQDDFVRRFRESGDTLSRSLSANDALAMAPKHFMDMISFSTVILLVLYLTGRYEGELSTILPVLALYALAGFKILPGFQQIYHAVATIKASSPAFDSIKDDLRQSNALENGGAAPEPIRDLPFAREIEFREVRFTYPAKVRPALQDVSFRIPANRTVGFVGATGSGKSTLVDLVMGLLLPDAGEILIDGQRLTPENLRAWQDKIGLVSQSIFLSDASIKENVAFGIPQDDIDVARVQEALALARLDDFVAELPQGMETRVGERGVQLSGGQRQRIGIARSLYHNPEVLVFDEATSALDGITERSIMQAIHHFAGSKTIILIAHRFTTIRPCDCIYFMEHGRIVDQGTYQQLMERNAHFREMSAQPVE